MHKDVTQPFSAKISHEAEVGRSWVGFQLTGTIFEHVILLLAAQVLDELFLLLFLSEAHDSSQVETV